MTVSDPTTYPQFGPPTTLPPPPPPAPAPSKRRVWPWVVGGVTALAVAGGGATAATLGADSVDARADMTLITMPRQAATIPARPDTIEVAYTLEVITEDYCKDFRDSGYSDLPYAEAEVTDGGGNLLGFGTLDGGYDTDTSCIFKADFDVKRSGDGFYRITAGNTNRGYLSYAESEVVGDTLVVFSTLGDD